MSFENPQIFFWIIMHIKLSYQLDLCNEAIYLKKMAVIIKLHFVTLLGKRLH